MSHAPDWWSFNYDFIVTEDGAIVSAHGSLESAQASPVLRPLHTWTRVDGREGAGVLAVWVSDPFRISKVLVDRRDAE